MAAVVDARPVYPENVDWAPPSEIIRLLARQTAAVTLPKPPVQVAPAPSDSQQDRIDRLSTPSYLRPRSLPPPVASQGREEPQLTEQGSDKGLGQSDIASVSTTLAPTLSKSTLSRSDQTLTIDSDMTPSPSADRLSKSKRSPRVHHFAMRTVATPQADDSWKASHDAPWSDTAIKGGEVAPEVTAKTCACGTTFAPGERSCRRCGTRRPIMPPEPIPKMRKAMHMLDPHHGDPFQRNYAWASAYDAKLYQTQVAKWDDSEDFVHENGHFNPHINDNSLRIAALQNAPPLHLRTEDIMTRRNEYLEISRKQMEQKELDGVTFQPEINAKSATMRGWRHENLHRWDAKRSEKINEKFEAQLVRETQQCPFTPSIGATSKDMAQDYAAIGKVHDRLSADARRREREVKQTQSILKKMTPKDFAAPAWTEDAPKPSPQRKRDGPPSVRLKRDMSAPLSRTLASAKNEERSSQPAIKSGRASMSLLAADDLDLDGRGSVKRQGRRTKLYARSASPDGRPTSGRWWKESRMSKLVAASEEDEARSRKPPKSEITNGKTTVLLTEVSADTFAGIADTLLL